MARLCDIQDPSMDVIYVCPVKQSVEVQQYYSRLLGLHKVVDSGLLEDAADMQDRFKILTPKAMDSF
ncbi:IQCH protein, partial [Polyodon spathula]|nr:IQCH protein [Polyodon spathula]